MKKLLLISILLFAGLCVYAQNAVIDQVTGTVEIKQPGESAFKAAKGGEKLSKDTIISTGFKSIAVIKIGGTTITARPLTSLTLKEIQEKANTETLNVNLQSGRVRVEVKPPAGTRASTTVSGPSSTASVRGTSFEFDVNNIYVNEGSVLFSGTRGQSIYVRAGESSRLSQDGTPTNPKDERLLNLMPPSIAGTDSGTTNALGSSVTGVSYRITLTFEGGSRPGRE